MNVEVFSSKEEMGAAAAEFGISKLRQSIAEKGNAAFVVATGASQFEMLESFSNSDLPWGKLTGFHLDEYIDLPVTHRASFRRYLRNRFVSLLPEPLDNFHFLNGEVDPLEECSRMKSVISKHAIDVAFVGIGENGHLAFNDPPADFETNEPFHVVSLDQGCREQQLGEGWFSDIDDVPLRALSMTIRQIMKSGTIVCTVPDKRKAQAVRDATLGPVAPEVPASILQTHPNCHLYLDQAAASLR